jgi:hypothetical protein
MCPYFPTFHNCGLALTKSLNHCPYFDVKIVMFIHQNRDNGAKLKNEGKFIVDIENMGNRAIDHFLFELSNSSREKGFHKNRFSQTINI